MCDNCQCVSLQEHDEELVQRICYFLAQRIDEYEEHTIVENAVENPIFKRVIDSLFE